MSFMDDDLQVFCSRLWHYFLESVFPLSGFFIQKRLEVASLLTEGWPISEGGSA
jgi:hypothetical protein